MDLSEHPIVKIKVPALVKSVLRKTTPPEGIDELIEFCQAITEIVIKDIEVTYKN